MEKKINQEVQSQLGSGKKGIDFHWSDVTLWKKVVHSLLQLQQGKYILTLECGHVCDAIHNDNEVICLTCWNKYENQQ